METSHIQFVFFSLKIICLCLILISCTQTEVHLRSYCKIKHGTNAKILVIIHSFRHRLVSCQLNTLTLVYRYLFFRCIDEYSERPDYLKEEKKQ